MSYNKIVLDDEIIMDLTGDTVSPEKMLIGTIAHDTHGEQITGTFDPSYGLLNSRYENGAVPAGDGNPNKVWRTDFLGNPYWGDEDGPALIDEHDSNPEAHENIRIDIKNIDRKTKELEKSDSEMLTKIDNLVSKLDSLVPENSTNITSLSALAMQVQSIRRDLKNLQISQLTEQDIADDLITTDATKILSALQGAVLKNMITEVSNRLNVIADSDDVTLDQFSEIVSYIKENRDLISDVIEAKKITWVDNRGSITDVDMNNFELRKTGSYRVIHEGSSSILLVFDLTSSSSSSASAIEFLCGYNPGQNIKNNSGYFKVRSVIDGNRFSEWSDIATVQKLPSLMSEEMDYNFVDGIKSKSIVGAINEVFQLGSENKQKLVTNLTAMGITCSTEDSWTTLIGQVLNIFTGVDTSDATATANQLLTGYSAYGSDGNKMDGIIPNRGSIVSDARAVTNDASYTYFYVPINAYYDVHSCLRASNSIINGRINLLNVAQAEKKGVFYIYNNAFRSRVFLIVTLSTGGNIAYHAAISPSIISGSIALIWEGSAGSRSGHGNVCTRMYCITDLPAGNITINITYGDIGGIIATLIGPS